jgi:hypothetical protein
MRRLAALALTLLLPLLAAPAAGAVPRFEVGLIGDAPYSADEVASVERLHAALDHERLAFVAHDGDIKGGSSPCTDELFLAERERFRRSLNPLVYIPGDNEWTDCHRTGGDPLERLRRLRELFFQEHESSAGARSRSPARAPSTRRTSAGPTRTGRRLAMAGSRSSD